MVGEDNGNHCLGHWNKAWQQTRVMATLGSDRRRFTLVGHRRLFQRKAAGWFDCRTKNNWKARGDPAEHPSMSIRVGGDPMATVWSRSVRRDKMVVMLAASHGDTAKPDAVLNPQDGREAEERFGEIRFDFVKDWLTQAGGDVGGNDLSRSADRIALFSNLLDQFNHLRGGCKVGTTNDIRLATWQSFNLRQCNTGWIIDAGFDFTNLCDVTDYAPVECLLQNFLSDNAGGDPDCRFTSTGTSTPSIISKPIF